MTKIEKLPGEVRAALKSGGHISPEEGRDALRIIDQLTAALEAAERDAQRQKDLGTYEASLKERRLRTAAESRAEALQARVAELEAACADHVAAWSQQAERRGKAEAELATAKARVAELEETVRANQRAADREYKRRIAAESELANVRLELAQLNAELARMQRARNDATARAEAFKHERSQTESELAQTRGRVERAIEYLTSPIARVPRALEALRGR